ncbi:DUF6276 family protein [Natrarchaeobaculum aegyptiacum]|uniref:Uncharacterized protein n=1 Tax=Natrarchaeobaculum aegyptiacum TaxID=745377 RepID=A0A2Z2HS73_9EURY|nr:DUF6276 family protein [Natrarchaeobaculum aegyptiacum]ARS90046.1 hypothetical protein B1756_10115 [Natrarchaeobaculum aegyptiacum]
MATSCPECGTAASPIVFSVPSAARLHLEADTAAFCPHCLHLRCSRDGAREAFADAVEDDAEPDFSRVSDGFPDHDEAAIPLALALGLCSSLATNRQAIDALLREVERAGTDPLLAIDRLLADPDVEPAIDLERRAHQLEQLLY